MTRDEIVTMALGVGFKVNLHSAPAFETVVAQFESFANLVAAQEREACKDACGTIYHQFIGPGFGEVRYGITACTEAIIARNK